MKVCDLNGLCKDSDKVWGLIKDNKIYRLTFSKSLVDLMKKQLDDDF